jgi:hypothetical protein
MARSIRITRLDVIIILGLVISPLLFFWPLILPAGDQSYTIPQGDFIEQYYPLRAYAAQRLGAGELPLWNPHLYGGQPALADIQSGALYPPHVLQSLLLGLRGGSFPLQALIWQMILHFSIGAAGLYLLSRRLVLEEGYPPAGAGFAGAVSALVFTFGGYLTGFPVQQLSILEGAVWLPWVLWAQSHLYTNSRFNLPWVSILAAFFALAILAGHPQTAMYIVYGSLAFLIFTAWLTFRKEEKRRAGVSRALRLSLSWAAALLLALLLAAPQLLPTLEFISLSPRASMNYEEVAKGLPAPEVAALLYPGYFGGSPQYLGILPLVLMAVAFLFYPEKQKVAFWSGLALLALLLSLGDQAFIYPIAYLFLPGFSAVRQQERALLLFSLAGALLAGMGAAALTSVISEELPRLRLFLKKMLLVGGVWGLLVFPLLIVAQQQPESLFPGLLRNHTITLVFLGLSIAWLGWLLLSSRAGGLQATFNSRRMASWLVAGIIIIAGNLFTVNGRFNLQPVHNPVPAETTEMVQVLRSETAQATPPWRIASAGFLPGGHSAAAYLQLYDTTGNTPLHIERMEEFSQKMPSWRYWQLLNVRYVLSERDISSPGVTARGDKIYHLEDPFPRAWLVHRYVVEADDGKALSLLAADAFDLRRQAVLPFPSDTVAEAANAPEEVIFSDVRPEERRLSVNAAAPGLLMISEGYYPGWIALLDGKPAAVLRADVTLQAVAMPAGQHELILRFEPLSFRRGIYLFIAGLMMTIGLAISQLAWRRD